MKKSFKRILYPALLLTVVGLIIGSCSKYPTYDVNTSDLDMVWTDYNDTVNYAAYKTYYVPDSMILDEDMDEKDKEDLQAYYEAVLVEVNKNMTALNYERVDSIGNPDLGISITIVTRTTYVVSYSYWWYYPPYWGYPGYSYAGSYEEGAVILDMADLKNSTPGQQKFTSLWSALIGGVLSGSSSNMISSRLVGGIDQAYLQSPYLGTE